MWFNIITKNKEIYFLDVFNNKYDTRNIAIIAKTFRNMSDFLQWYSKKKFIYYQLLHKCNTVGVSSEKIILAIYEGHYEDLYDSIDKLNEFIDDFKSGYEN